MTYKTILAIIQGENDIDRMLDTALPLAARLNGHLIAVHAEPLPVPYTTAIGFPDAEFMQATSEVNTKRAASLEAKFKTRISTTAISAEWHSMESFSGDSAMSALAFGRTSDLILAPQTDPSDNSAEVANIDALLFDTGRPALVVPYTGNATTDFHKVLIAWNGTKEAARAAFDALPFILEARQTDILTIDEDESAESGGDALAAALTRHGANVSVVKQSSAGIDVSSVIENHVSESGADLLVMGAFSHSRLREFLFGGVTREVLKSMPIATFMSR